MDAVHLRIEELVGYEIAQVRGIRRNGALDSALDGALHNRIRISYERLRSGRHGHDRLYRRLGRSLRRLLIGLRCGHRSDIAARSEQRRNGPPDALE